jgi:hypothetical protein
MVVAQLLLPLHHRSWRYNWAGVIELRIGLTPASRARASGRKFLSSCNGKGVLG